MTPAEYLAAMEDPTARDAHVTGLCGRILRGRTEADFERLSDDPARPVVLLTDSDGLAALIARSGYERLRTLGYTEAFIAHLLRTGHRFRVVVLPEADAELATWDVVLRVAQEVCPQAGDAIARHGAALRATPFAAIEAAAGYRFAAADEPGDPRFMDCRSFAVSTQGLVELRALLYHRLHLKELFSGDGFTYDSAGRRGVREYLVPNTRVAEIPGALVQDLDVALPRAHGSP